MSLYFSELLTEIKYFDLKDVADPEPWWDGARETWAKAAEDYSTHWRTYYDDQVKIQELLPRFASHAVVYGPEGRHEIEGITFTPQGAAIIKTDDYVLEAPVGSVMIGRGGIAKWNTYLLVRFSEMPAIWADYFEDSEPWILITHQTSAFCAWKRMVDKGPHHCGLWRIESLYGNLGVQIDRFTWGGEPWPTSDFAERQGYWPEPPPAQTPPEDDSE